MERVILASRDILHPSFRVLSYFPFSFAEGRVIRACRVLGSSGFLQAETTFLLLSASKGVIAELSWLGRTEEFA